MHWQEKHFQEMSLMVNSRWIRRDESIGVVKGSRNALKAVRAWILSRCRRGRGCSHLG